MSRLEMKAPAVAATLIGLGLAVTLLIGNDLRRIGLILLAARWSILLVVALHLPQSLAATLGWRTLLGRPAPGFWLLYRLRWVRDSANTLLPVARVGGDFIRIRLLAARDMSVMAAAASSVVDVSLELGTQIIFTLGAVMLLVNGPHSGDPLPLGIGALTGSVLVTALLYGMQRLGLLRLVERLAERGGGWDRLGKLSGLHEAVVALYRQRRPILSSGGYHLLAWVLGGVETYAALRILGVAAGAREAIVIEALGHAARAAGFLIPGALGVQEGGYLLVCAMFGIGPQTALALSLIRRARELILGLPGLLVWHRMEVSSAASVLPKVDFAP
jgi:putative membrane protein